VFYDLQFGARLSAHESAKVAYVPPFEATAIGIVAKVNGEEQPPDGTPVAVIDVTMNDGNVQNFELRAGADVTDVEQAIRIHWPYPAVPVALSIQATLPRGQLIVRGSSLIDERTGSFQSLVLSDQGYFRLAHSGDVKIYENMDVRPRAFLVHHAAAAADQEQALALMQDGTFDPTTQIVLEQPVASYATSPGQRPSSVVHITHYAPEQVIITVETDTPGYLVLTDSWYPGWQASVDGEQTDIIQANLLFRAVALDAGIHQVVFSFRPTSLRAGIVTSLFGLAILIAAALLLRK
jgi:hypothetical protein